GSSAILRCWNGGKQVIYVEQLSQNRKKMKGVFMAERSPKSLSWEVLSAKSGEQDVNKESNELFIITHNGYRYIGTPGQNDYQILQYQRYGIKLQSRLSGITTDSDALPTHLLLASYKLPKYAAELQWRISLPLMTLILILLAVPLSQLTRGQGRYAKMFPAILIYILYANLLFIGRNWVEQGSISILVGVWWVHLLALGLACTLLFSHRLQ
ncbi:MAG: LptF/LptG family permease, partial [Gammaproteobacteria bacterium]